MSAWEKAIDALTFLKMIVVLFLLLKQTGQVIFYGIHCENLGSLLEVNGTQMQSLKKTGTLEYLISSTCPHEISSYSSMVEQVFLPVDQILPH